MHPMTAGSHFGDTPATDEVIDAIAEIEAHRQAMEREAGPAAAASGALRRLHAEHGFQCALGVAEQAVER